MPECFAHPGPEDFHRMFEASRKDRPEPFTDHERPLPWACFWEGTWSDEL